MLTATSDRHLVTIPLDAAEQSEMKTGDEGDRTAAGRETAPARISSVGAVATTSQGQQEHGPDLDDPGPSEATHPQAAGTLDQAPVTVTITTASVKNMLAVPVAALLADSSRGYDVEWPARGTPPASGSRCSLGSSMTPPGWCR